MHGPRQRFFIFFLKFFAEGHGEGPRQRALSNFFVFGPLPRAQIHGPRQRFFIFNFKILCRGPQVRPSAKSPRQFFFLVFLAQFFCGATIHCFELNFKIQANFDFVLYISLIYFDSLIFF